MPVYIDADKMLANICAECLDEGTDECKNGNCTERNWINNTQVEDVKPVVHAHWILRRPFAQCSKCKRFCGQWDYDSADYFCRNCGAKMDEEPEADES